MKEHNGLLKTALEAGQAQMAICESMHEDNRLLNQELRAVSDELRRVKDEFGAVKKEIGAIKDEIGTIKAELRTTEAQGVVEVQKMQERLDAVMAVVSGQSSPNPSYADIARTPPTSQPSNVRSVTSMNTTPSTFTDRLFCTIDASRVEETDKNKQLEVQGGDGGSEECEQGQDCLARRATTFWVNLNTLPDNHPLAATERRMTKRFTSPLQNTPRHTREYRSTIWRSSAHSRSVRGKNEWRESRTRTQQKPSKGAGGEVAPSSLRARQSGAKWSASGGVLRPSRTAQLMVAATLGTRDEQNPFTAELAAMSRALDALPLQLQYGNITILTRNKAATQAVSRPHHQSGQEDIRRIYATFGKLRSRGNSVSIRWIPTGTEGDLTRTAKGAAKRSANPQKLPVRSPYRAASTTLAAARKDQADCQTLPDEVGKYSKRIGTALPGKHTRRIYDALTAAQARKQQTIFSSDARDGPRNG
ncbi:hypothetical protein BN1723_011998 [Verticillium longisporum]|nr:hypothetical protein BN1723_011998 [Verticillium longisporum]